MANKSIAVGSDHAGYKLKIAVKQHLESQGFEVKDYGTNSLDRADYPDFAHPVAQAVQDGEFSRGVLVCGSGQGVAMSANKHEGVRAALCWAAELAKVAREHNDANILCLPERFISQDKAIEAVDAFLNTDFEGGRHQNRVNKINHC